MLKRWQRVLCLGISKDCSPSPTFGINDQWGVFWAANLREAIMTVLFDGPTSIVYHPKAMTAGARSLGTHYTFSHLRYSHHLNTLHNNL